jgi:thiamine biosynthesis lipoprotein
MRLILFITIFFLSCSTKDRTEKVHFSGKTMGTTYNISFINSEKNKIFKKILSPLIEQRLKEVNQAMSTYIPTSEISIINKTSKAQSFKISKDFSLNIKKSLEISKLSDGAFDITVMPLVNAWGFGWKKRSGVILSSKEIDSLKNFVGFQHLSLDSAILSKSNKNTQIDLSAIAKGFGVDACAQVLEDKNIENYLVEIGGEVRAKGKNERGETWKIGIETPAFGLKSGASFEEIIAVSNVGIATSGNYRNYYEIDGVKYAHTIDPRSGKPIRHQLASATVVAKTCMEADALATTLMVMGEKEGLKFINSLENIYAMFIVRSGDKFEKIYSDGFKKMKN